MTLATSEPVLPSSVARSTEHASEDSQQLTRKSERVCTPCLPHETYHGKLSVQIPVAYTKKSSVCLRLKAASKLSTHVFSCGLWLLFHILMIIHERFFAKPHMANTKQKLTDSCHVISLFVQDSTTYGLTLKFRYTKKTCQSCCI